MAKLIGDVGIQREDMGIDCHLQNEAQEDVQIVADPHGILSYMVNEGRFAKCQVLQYLDAYGDLILNAAQMKTAIRELEVIHAQTSDKGQREHLERLLTLLKNTERQATHMYMWFIGD